MDSNPVNCVVEVSTKGDNLAFEKIKMVVSVISNNNFDVRRISV